MKTKNILFPIYFILCFSMIAQNTCAQLSGDTINFENEFSNLYIDTLQLNNIWQVGKPQKTLFDSAYSKYNAIITDTFNTYPINNTSSFIVKFLRGNENWSPNWPGPFPFIGFTHKYNTDTILDGGHLEYSIDAGINWLPVQNYQNNWGPSTLGSSDPYFSGTFNQWQQTFVYFFNAENAYTGTIDSILIKFVFTSDGINTAKEGWVIDNIVYGSFIGEGVEEYNDANGINIYPNPNTGEFNIIMNNKQGIINNEINIYNILGEKIYYNPKFKEQTSSQIDLSAFQKGIYFIKIHNKGATHSEKIVVQ